MIERQPVTFSFVALRHLTNSQQLQKKKKEENKQTTTKKQTSINTDFKISNIGARWQRC